MKHIKDHIKNNNTKPINLLITLVKKSRFIFYFLDCQDPALFFKSIYTQKQNLILLIYASPKKYIKIRILLIIKEIKGKSELLKILIKGYIPT